jgi:hypothetical protein
LPELNGNFSGGPIRTRVGRDFLHRPAVKSAGAVDQEPPAAVGTHPPGVQPPAGERDAGGHPTVGRRHQQQVRAGLDGEQPAAGDRHGRRDRGHLRARDEPALPAVADAEQADPVVAVAEPDGGDPAAGRVERLSDERQRRGAEQLSPGGRVV